MPRYFFNTQNSSSHIDLEGEELTDLTQAHREAVVLLADIVGQSPVEFLKDGHFRLELTDEHGAILLQLVLNAVHPLDGSDARLNEQDGDHR